MAPCTLQGARFLLRARNQIPYVQLSLAGGCVVNSAAALDGRWQQSCHVHLLSRPALLPGCLVSGVDATNVGTLVGYLCP